jgi:hypothetical protein
MSLAWIRHKPKEWSEWGNRVESRKQVTPSLIVSAQAEQSAHINFPHPFSSIEFFFSFFGSVLFSPLMRQLWSQSTDWKLPFARANDIQTSAQEPQKKKKKKNLAAIKEIPRNRGWHFFRAEPVTWVDNRVLLGQVDFWYEKSKRKNQITGGRKKNI